jgi:hypothetical protein
MRDVERWAALPSHKAYVKAADWYWRTVLSLVAAAALAFLLSKVAPYPRLPLPVYLAGFLPFPILLAIGLRHTWRMIHLRRQEIAAGAFAGAPNALQFLDQHAIAIGVAVILLLTAIAIVLVAAGGGP